jgi:hypothetical protein
MVKRETNIGHIIIFPKLQRYEMLHIISFYINNLYENPAYPVCKIYLILSHI